MKVSMSRTREQFPLSTKKVIKKTLASTLALAIILLVFWAIVAIAVSSANGGDTDSGTTSMTIIGIITVGIFGFMAVVLLLTYLYQKWYYAVYFYDLTDDFIIIKKGPITPREITIPYERVQDVYVDQDLLDRIFGLYDVHLSSATISSGMEAHIDGVEKQAADGLRDFLLQTVQQKISKNKSQHVISNNMTNN